MRKRRKSEELDAALRAEPEYKELCELLSKQTPERQSRSERYLASLCEGSQEEETTMESKNKAALERAFELQAEGKSFAKIAETLNQEGFRNAKGNPFDRSGLRKLMLRNKAKLSQGSQTVAQQTEPGALSQPSQDLAHEWQGPEISQFLHTIAPEDKKSDPSQPSPHCESVTIDETAAEREPGACDTGDPSHTSIPCEWIAPLRSLMREEIDRAMRESANTATVAMPVDDVKDRFELPPSPPRVPGGRKYAGTKVTMGGARIDKAVFDAFAAKRRELRVDASRLVEALLWVGLGKPKLSFEIESDPSESERR